LHDVLSLVFARLFGQKGALYTLKYGS